MLALISLLITLILTTTTSTSASAPNTPPNPLLPFDTPYLPPAAPITNYHHPLLATINYATATTAHSTPSSIAAAIQPGQLNYFNLSRPEGERFFYLYVPSSYGQNKTGHPLAFFFHGYSGGWRNGVDFNITRVAERMGWFVAFPQGTRATTGAAGWNAGACCLFNTTTVVDDVTFTKLAIRAIEAAVLVDPRRRYAMGWSNGAMMSERLACEAPEQFAGICADEGAVVLGNNGVEAGLAQCDRSFGTHNRINYLAFHGTADPTVSWTGGGFFPSTLQDLTRWVTRQNCSGRVSQSFNDGVFSNIVWNDCRDGREVELMTVRNGVHWWWTLYNGGFETAEYAFRWFDRTYHKQLAADEAREKEQQAAAAQRVDQGRHAAMSK